MSRAAVLVFGVVLALLALAFARFDGILWLAFKITGVTFGSLLGVFLLALLPRRPRLLDAGNVVAMVLLAASNLWLLWLSETGALPLAWSWLVVLGTAGTMLVAVAIGWVARRGR